MKTAEEKHIIANSKKAIETQEGVFIPLEEVREMLKAYKNDGINSTLLDVVKRIEGAKFLEDAENHIISSATNLGLNRAKDIIQTFHLEKLNSQIKKNNHG